VRQEVSLNELAKYIFEYMKREGFIFTQKTDPILRSTYATDEEITGIGSECPLHGRYFTRIGMDLYVYLGSSQWTMNYDLFNKEIDLFGPESAWRMSRKMAIVRGVNKFTLEVMEKRLSERGFVRRDASRETLEASLKTNDTSRLIK
jgi:hypothetical protein